jgi:Flp pilus assembly protein TadG
MRLIRRVRTSRRVRRDERGAVAILVAGSFVVMLMAAAFAIDLGNVASTQRQGSHAADAAAVSAGDILAQNGVGSAAQATAYAEAQQSLESSFPQDATPNWDGCGTPQAGFAPMAAGEDCVNVDTALHAVNVVTPPVYVAYGVAKAGGFSGTYVEGSATAEYSGVPGACGLCALNGSGVALNATGNPTINVVNGAVAVDSASNGALTVTGSSQITGTAINVVGTYSGPAGDVSPQPNQGAAAVPDPLGSLSMPPSWATGSVPTTTTSCPTTTAAGGNVSDNGCNMTLEPGNYGSISMGGNGTLTFAPGDYVITGAFDTTGTASVSATGVTLYFTCSSTSGGVTVVSACPSDASEAQSTEEPEGSLDEEGTGSVVITPPTTGTYAGISVLYDRNDDAGLTIKGTSSLSLAGTVYAKSATLTILGTSTTADSLIVVGAVDDQGTGTFTIDYTKANNAAVPADSYLCSVGAGNC